MTDYEAPEILDQYLLFHFGSESEQMPWPEGPREALGFPRRCAEALARALGKGPCRVLEVGCAVGGACFELARAGHEVLGLDYSASFVGVAQRLSRGEALRAEMREGGGVSRFWEVRAPMGTRADRVRFQRGDAQRLDWQQLGRFDGILAANLLCRLPDPNLFLETLPKLLRAGGKVLIATPHTWMEVHTPRERWPGGPQGDPGAGLRAAMKALGMRMLEERNLPFLIREHSRKYQWSVADLSLWERSPVAGE